MINFFEKLLALIYTRRCFYCKSTKEDKILCSKCIKKIHYLPPSIYRKINGCDIFVCSLYDDVIKQLIKDLKYKNKKNLAKIQAKIMFEYFKQLNLSEKFIIISVPIHKNRKKERQYNHMDLVADEITKLSGIKNNKNFLMRIKDTKKQFNLTKQERKENIKNAFEINQKENIEKTQNLLIIDDIISTGITLEEIIKLLKNNGYNNLTALALSTPDIWNKK